MHFPEITHLIRAVFNRFHIATAAGTGAAAAVLLQLKFFSRFVFIFFVWLLKNRLSVECVSV